MSCPIGAALDALSEGECEIVDMVLSDREGYDDELAARALHGYVEADKRLVADHRSGDCGCR